MLDAHTVVSTFGGSMSRDVEVYEPFQANKPWVEAEIPRSTLMLHNRSVGQVAKKRICVLRFWKDKEVTITYSMHSFKHSFIGMAFCICPCDISRRFSFPWFLFRQSRHFPFLIWHSFLDIFRLRFCRSNLSARRILPICWRDIFECQWTVTVVNTMSIRLCVATSC